MMSAAEMNDTETLSRALALAGSVNLRDESSGCTAMHHAVRCGSLDAISMLLAAGADCTIKDNVGCSSFMHAAFRDDPSSLKVILDSMETSTFCALLQFQPIGLFESLESSCRTFAEKLLGVGTASSSRLSPPVLSLLVWRLPAAAIMGLDTDSLSHFVAICCFVGCEHSAKAIMSRRPAVLSCVQARGLSLLHIAVLTGARSVAQQALLSATSLADSRTPKRESTSSGELPRACNRHSLGFKPQNLVVTHPQLEETRLCILHVWAALRTTNAASESFCLPVSMRICALQRVISLGICCCRLFHNRQSTVQLCSLCWIGQCPK